MIKEYDRARAVDYARKWALSKNPQFGYFGGIGGDCTNFISQCLLAGGGVMNYDYINGWFFESMSHSSPSWTSVVYLQNYLLRKNNEIGPLAKIVPIDDIEIGDIIQLRQNPSHFNHTVIVTKIMGGDIYVCAHSNDALDKPLDRFFKQAILPLHIEGVRI